MIFPTRLLGILLAAAITRQSVILPCRISAEKLSVPSAAAMSASVSPGQYQNDLWDYNISQDETDGELYCTLNLYLGSEIVNEMIFPEEIDGIPVRRIGKNMFSIGAGNFFTELVFPSGVTELYFFSNNNSRIKRMEFRSEHVEMSGNFKNMEVEELVLPVDTAGKDMFVGCTMLKRVEFKNAASLDIGVRAFSGCDSLTEVIFPKNCQKVTIANNAFEGCPIGEISMDSSCTVSTNAFKDCKKLSSVSIGGDTDVNDYAFRYCDSLKSFSVKGKCTLGDFAFIGCSSLENADIDISEPINGLAFNECTALMTINSEPVFDEKAGDLRADIKEIICRSFCNTNDVGFINRFVQASAEKAVCETITADMSDAEKIRALHDWVCTHASYDYDDVNARKNHNDLAVFIGNSTVCDGYARTLNLLLNAAGIETYYVQNEEHIWNIVALGGQYFHVDTTWDDTEPITYDWFLRSDAELREQGAPHDVWELYTPSSLHSFQGEKLPECRYRIGDTNADGKLDGDDLKKLRNTIMCAEENDPQYTVLSDLTCDGAVNVFDMIALRKKIAVQRLDICNM